MSQYISKAPVHKSPCSAATLKQTNKFSAAFRRLTATVTDHGWQAGGRLFQKRGPATANALSPSDVVVRGMSSIILAADREPERPRPSSSTSSAAITDRPRVALLSHSASLEVIPNESLLTIGLGLFRTVSEILRVTQWVVWANDQFATVFFSFLFPLPRPQVALCERSEPVRAQTRRSAQGTDFWRYCGNTLVWLAWLLLEIYL